MAQDLSSLVAAALAAVADKLGETPLLIVSTKRDPGFAAIAERFSLENLVDRADSLLDTAAGEVADFEVTALMFANDALRFTYDGDFPARDEAVSLAAVYAIIAGRAQIRGILRAGHWPLVIIFIADHFAQISIERGARNG